MSTQSNHGGNIYKAAREHGFEEKDIIDFSGNINPLGIPSSVKKTIADNLHLLSIYPDPEYYNLRTIIADYIQTDRDNILVGNGATELISLFIKAIKPKKAMIISPAYSEYEREVKLNGGEVERYRLKEELDFKLDIDNLHNQLKDNIELLIICNPNNPTGQAITKEEMEQILVFCKSRAIYVMVDETYVEFTRDIMAISSISLTNKYDNLFVIRGVSKFFAAPGLRLGYGIISNQSLRSQIEERKDPWSANILAVTGGEALFTDKEYIEKAKKTISEERDFVVNFLKEISFIKVFEPNCNFVLCKIIDGEVRADYLKDKLLAQGMLIRDASSFPFLDNRFFRICFMDRQNNIRLLTKIKEIFYEGVM